MPKTMYYEITNICNLKCTHCFHQKIKDENWLPREKALDLVSHIKRLGISELVITGGEPFLVPYIVEFLELLYNNDIKVTIFTNCQNWNNIEVLKISKYITGFRFSIDGLDEDSHNKNRGGNNWKYIYNAIKDCESNNIKFSLMYTILPNNIHFISTNFIDFTLNLKLLDSFNIDLVQPENINRDLEDFIELDSTKNYCEYLYANLNKSKKINVLCHNDYNYNPFCVGAKTVNWLSKPGSKCLYNEFLFLSPKGEILPCLTKYKPILDTWEKYKLRIPIKEYTYNNKQYRNWNKLGNINRDKFKITGCI